jgi:hypothetical protein
MSRSVKDKGDGEHILKKYSRAAGDRIQWKKVEAMMFELKFRKARQGFGFGFLGGIRHVPRSPAFVRAFIYTKQSDGHARDDGYAIKIKMDDEVVHALYLASHVLPHRGFNRTYIRAQRP